MLNNSLYTLRGGMDALKEKLEKSGMSKEEIEKATEALEKAV
jgi:uncharacterized protein Smg (DUF494 family)